MIVTGIGSRPKGIPSEALPYILSNLLDIASVANKNGWTLRSGGADGMDTFFEDVWNVNKEIYLPYQGFNRHFDGFNGSILVEDPTILAMAGSIAASVHPIWKRLNKQAKEFHTRNVFQVLGADLTTPSDLCIFYARIDSDGEVEGGTRTAVELCKQNGIATYNLRSTDDVVKLGQFLEEWR